MIKGPNSASGVWTFYDQLSNLLSFSFINRKSYLSP
jgi:hypothetical protein